MTVTTLHGRAAKRKPQKLVKGTKCPGSRRGQQMGTIAGVNAKARVLAILDRQPVDRLAVDLCLP